MFTNNMVMNDWIEENNKEEFFQKIKDQIIESKNLFNTITTNNVYTTLIKQNNI